MVTGGLSTGSFGVKKAVEALSGALVAAGEEVMVFGMGAAGVKGRHDPNWQGAPVQALRVQGPSKFGYMPELYRALVEYRPDVVHLHGLWMYSSLLASRIVTNGISPVVISPHGMLASESLRYSKLAKTFAMKLYQRPCFDHASGFFATSQQESRDIAGTIKGKRVIVVPNTVLKPEIDLRDFSNRRSTVIAVGRLHHVKGYDRLLKAWNLIEARFKDWNLEIRGPDEGGYSQELNKLNEELGNRRVSIDGPVFGSRRDLLVSNSKIFVLPSRTENFSVAVVESLYCGTPVIASHDTPWSDLEKSGSGWWTSCEPQDLAKCLANVMESGEEHLDGVSQRGRTWVSDMFAPNTVAEATYAGYQKILEA